MEGAGGSVSCCMQTTERLAAQFGSWPPPPPTPTTLDRVGVADVQAAPAPVPAPRMRPRPATQAITSDKGSRTGGGKAKKHRFVKEALKHSSWAFIKSVMMGHSLGMLLILGRED